MRTYTSEREVRRTAVFSRVVKAGWTLLEAAERMEVSYRQAKRRWKRYRGEGGRG
jgi:transposase